MPRSAPIYRAPGRRNAKPWARSTGMPDKRKRGRAGQRDRAMVLAEEPFCRSCLRMAKRVASEEVDHIVPLSEGGNDERSNKQGLCKPCHADKSAAERARARRRAARA